MTIDPSHSGGDAKPSADFRVVGPAEHAGALVLCLEGEFDLAAVPVFEEAAGALPPSTRLIVDLRPLGYMDSSGIGALLRLDARLREGGGKLDCVVASEGMVRRLFELTGLGESLDICEEPPG